MPNCRSRQPPRIAVRLPIRQAMVSIGETGQECPADAGFLETGLYHSVP